MVYSMNNEQITAILKQIPNLTTLEATGDGYHFQIKLVGDVFAGKNTLARQRYVYQFLKDYIADGSLHAVEIKALTTQEV